MMRDHCVTCGQFIRYSPGASWAQSWSYDMSGFPDLHDPRWQCAKCTEQHGPLGTNCAHPERYSGVLRAGEIVVPNPTPEISTFSLTAFRDFCAAKPKEERYSLWGLDPVNLFDPYARETSYNRHVALNAVWSWDKPRTYGALTARLDALIGEKK